MKIFLNLVLLCVGTLATAVAFGGETWKKGKGHLYWRITWRGWISLTCLVVALLVGFIKEIREGIVSKRDADTAAAVQVDLKNRLSSTLIQLSAANSNISDLKNVINQQSVAAMINELGVAHLKVAELELRLHFKPAPSNISTVHDVILPHMGNAACDDWTEPVLLIMLGDDRRVGASYPDGLEANQYYMNESHSLRTISEFMSEGYVDDNHRPYNLRLSVQLLGEHISAADVYSALIKRDDPGIGIFLKTDWPEAPVGHTLAELPSLYPNIFEGLPIVKGAKFHFRIGKYPDGCALILKKHLGDEIDEANLFVYLDSPEGETFHFRLKQERPEDDDSDERSFVRLLPMESPRLELVSPEHSYKNEEFDDRNLKVIHRHPMSAATRKRILEDLDKTSN